MYDVRRVFTDRAGIARLHQARSGRDVAARVFGKSRTKGELHPPLRTAREADFLADTDGSVGTVM